MPSAEGAGHRLICSDGYEVENLVAVPGGRSHHVYFGTEAGAARPVVVKMEVVGGRLAVEERALTWLWAQGAPVPKVRRFAAGRLGDGPLRPCLVTDRVDGRPPRTAAAWGRMGRALHELGRIPPRGSGLPTWPVPEFVRSHRAKVEALGDRLAGSSVPAAVGQVLAAPTPALGPLVVTHGDPGPGNYLETATAPVMIDWEVAQIAPRGLDMARAAFVALLVADGSGKPADRTRARAVIAGYLDGGDWRPTISELQWWLAVAGVQVTHNRWERRGQPRVLPWADSVTVLAAALRDDWLTSLVAG